MLRSPFLLICCVFLIFFLAVLPVMQLVAFAARGAISPVLLLYVIALAAMLFVTIKQDGADFAGVAEYTFSDNNFTVKNEQGTCTTEYSAIYAVREIRNISILCQANMRHISCQRNILPLMRAAGSEISFHQSSKAERAMTVFREKVPMA